MPYTYEYVTVHGDKVDLGELILTEPGYATYKGKRIRWTKKDMKYFGKMHTLVCHTTMMTKWSWEHRMWPCIN